MRLCSLIYNNKHGINSSNDPVSIMNIGNQLYSRLSQSAGQTFLMQTELPTMLNMFETISWSTVRVSWVVYIKKLQSIINV